LTLFLSYAHQDLDVVTSLRRDLEDLGQAVWLDESLHGGQIWWDEILRQVRQCNGFVLAVSGRSLQSEACLAEWGYAVDLARPFLPVRIDATEWTGAPDRMRQSQHIDYKPNDANSIKALVKSLGGFVQAVPLPEVLPPPPPTPMSYHERYAKLFGPAPLTFDDQINYFARLTTDIDSANASDALELLAVLRNREDLTVKMGKRIDEFVAQRNSAIGAGAPGEPQMPAFPPPPRDATEGGGRATTAEGGADDTALPDAPSPTPDPGGNHRLRWIIGAAAALVLIAGTLAVVFRPKSHGDAAPLVENTTCDADNCSDPPIRFLDITGDPDTITVTIDEPNGVTKDADPPIAAANSTLRWDWSASDQDPIGDYTVHFAGTDAGTVDHTFTVNPVDGAFGVVQRAGQAIAKNDWRAAAAIDHRIKDELDQHGAAFLDAEYPTPSYMYWLPYDASGETNANGTTIVGAFITHIEADDQTTAYCELWSVDPGDETMRSEPLPRGGNQDKTSRTGEIDPNDFY